MDAPPSPNHVFNFLEVEFEEDPQEEPKEEFEEDPEEDPKEEVEAEAEDDVPPPATLSVGSPITLPPLSESSSDIEDVASVIENEALEMPPISSTYHVDGNTELLLSNVQYLERCEKKRKTDMEAGSSEIREVKKRMDKMDQDLGDEMQFSNVVEHRVTELENREQEKAEEMDKMKKRLGTLEANYSLVLSDRDEWRKRSSICRLGCPRDLDGVFWMHTQMLVMMGQFLLGSLNLPNCRDLLAVPSSLIMPPKKMKRKAVNKMVKKRIAEAIEEYERTRVKPGNASWSGETNTGGPVIVHGSTHKTFINGKPHPFNGTEGFVGLRRWIEKVEQVFEICKCAEEDKVMFAASTFEGRALTWWNGNVRTLGLVNANHIPWTEFKSMMTTEYCPAIEIQRMEEELWTLTLKEDDIEAYNNRFHELALMCPDLVPNEKKKIERYMKGFPRRIKGNITSARPTTLHEAVNLARELMEQAVQGKAARANENNKRRWEEHQRNHPNNNNNNNPNNHCKARLPGTDDNPLRNVTCYGCGEKGHLRHLCLKKRNQQNEGARARAYVVVENLQQNPNVVTGTFLLNDHYASVLFDSGAERSLVSIEFTHFINISLVALNASYDVELADGKIVSTNTVLRGCTLALFSHMVKINLLPTRLGSYDVIVGMDWLSYHRAVIVCYEKIVRIPLPNGEILEIHSERPEKDLKSLLCIKADEVRLDDIRPICDFPEVFTNDLTGLPTIREIEFRIDLIPGIHVDPSKVESVKNWKTPESPTEIRSFLGLGEASKDLKAPAEWLWGLERHFEKWDDGGVYIFDRIWIPSVGGIRKLIMDEAHTSRYLVHLGADKMYYDLRDLYWWPGMKRDITEYVSKCLTCSKIKAEHQKPSGLLQQPEIPEWKWEKITMDLVTKLAKSSNGHDAIWVVVDRLAKSAHFLPFREDYKTEKLARIYINEIVARHGVGYKTKHEYSLPPRDGCWDTHLPLVEFSYNNSYHKIIKCAPFEVLYGRKCRSPVIWTEIRESQLIGPEIVQETTEKIFQIKERLKTARSRQKSYADKRQKPLEFKVEDRVLLKELSCIHDTFHVSNLKKCLAESDAQIPLEEIKVDENLRFVKEPIEIVERDVKKLKRRRIPLVKVRWNSRQGAEYTWEREDQFKTRYPHLFASTSSAVAS
uniref:Reverse transcriptase domain-containing protein n=1 Tax=Tanacetum cinerariifolium TaxID=118510 RepID=A0A6L2L8Z8_TANCI|nr:reverse transcriptase domain-containing protein [Tanacetum cinerariifolium]